MPKVPVMIIGSKVKERKVAIMIITTERQYLSKM